MAVESLRVALLVESSHGFGRAVLQGIAQYANSNGPWTFYHQERGIDDPMPKDLRTWRPHGIIARITTSRLVRQLRRLDTPLVDLYEQYQDSAPWRVMVNHQAVVQQAVVHLRECGLQHFAYVGFPAAHFSSQRAQLFSQCVRLWRFSPHIFTPPVSRRPEGLSAHQSETTRHQDSLAAWLAGLPKPVGLMCCNDMRAEQVLTLCKQQGLTVPDDVAVIGVDNDEVRCELSAPSLSSVDPNAHRLGYEAARLLHRLIRGQHRSPQTILVEPAGVVARRSTDVLAFADPGITQIVRHIRENACKGLSTDNLIASFGMSRATLDRWFVQALGRTPHAEITRVQVQRMRELLATTDFPLKKIAHLTGFPRVETMHRVFQRASHQTPTEYRKATR